MTMMRGVSVKCDGEASSGERGGGEVAMMRDVCLEMSTYSLDILVKKTRLLIKNILAINTCM